MFSLLAATVFICATAAAYGSMRRRSRLLALVFAFGIVARLSAGIALFVISRFHVGVFRDLQLGDGFWALAPDGRNYYDLASRAVTYGLGAIQDGSASPFYVRVLALWMWALGVSPISAFLLNVACYAASAALIVVASTRGRPAPAESEAGAIVSLAAITFSPALLIFSTQPLKDALFVLLMIAGVVGANVWWTSPSAGERWDGKATVLGGLLVLAGIFGVAGIRSYMAFITIVAYCVAGAFAVVWRSDAGPGRRWNVVRNIALLLLLWAAFAVGGGADYRRYSSFVASTWSNPSTPIAALDRARNGFVASGGATALTAETAEGFTGLASARTRRDAALSQGTPTRGARVGNALRGALVLWVPVSLLRLAAVVSFSGGRGLLLITDIDTLTADATVAISLCFLVISLRHGRMTPGMVFVLVLAVLTTVSLGYVVTNYGTLFRLRLLGVTPLWMLPILRSHDRRAS